MHFWNVAIALVLLSAASRAQDLEVLFCEIPSSPKSVVPGALDDITGLPEATNFRAIEDVILSPGGTAWLLKGRTQQGSNEENILLLGAGTSGTMFSQEGQPMPGGVPGEVVDFFGSGIGRFNSLDQLAYSARARGGSAATFQKVILWDGTSSTITTQMGDLYTGLDDLPPNPIGDEIVGNSIGSIHLMDDLRIGAQDSTIGNIHSSKRPAIFYDQAMFHQADTTTVLNMSGSGTILIDGVSANTFYTTPDGAHWLALVDVDPGIPSDNALAYDGQVLIQNGQPVPGSLLVSGSIFNARIGANGDWFARGRDNSGTTASAPDWAVRSGSLIAATGDALGGGESYGQSRSPPSPATPPATGR